MSVTYSAHTITGVRVPVEKLFNRQVKMHTAHPYPKDAKYCPTCGNKVEEEVLDIPIYDEINCRLGSFSVFILEDKEDVAFVGHHIEVVDYKSPRWLWVDLEDLNKVKDELKEELSPRGLWDESLFGVYTIVDWL